VWVAAVKRPPVLERFKPTPEPEVAPDGDSVDGWVRKANASFSVLNGTVMRAPCSSPSVTRATLPPGYFFCSCVLAVAISAGVNPLTVVPLDPCIRAFGNSSLRPTVTEPSALKVALVSMPQPTAASRTAATRTDLAITLATGDMLSDRARIRTGLRL